MKSYSGGNICPKVVLVDKVVSWRVAYFSSYHSDIHDNFKPLSHVLKLDVSKLFDSLLATPSNPQT